MKRPGNVVLTLAALVAPLFVAGQLRADTIIINDLTDSTSITQIGSSVQISAHPCKGENCSFTISRFNSVTPPLAQLPFGLVEPGPFDLISDILFAESQSDFSVRITFQSDPENGIFPCGPVFHAVVCVGTENGTPQTITTISWADGTTATIQVQSDISDPVPEPSSLFLFGTSLVGIAGKLLKRKFLS